MTIAEFLKALSKTKYDWKIRPDGRIRVTNYNICYCPIESIANRRGAYASKLLSESSTNRIIDAVDNISFFSGKKQPALRKKILQILKLKELTK